MMINNIGRVTPLPVGQIPSIIEEGRIRHQLINLSSLICNSMIGGLRQFNRNIELLNDYSRGGIL